MLLTALLTFLTIQPALTQHRYPPAMFHGLFDRCGGYRKKMAEFTNQTGIHFECIEIG